jgi:Septum formation initiator
VTPVAPVAPAEQAAASRLRAPRTPFVFLLVGLLSGGLICLLVLNTVLAAGTFQITSLQQSNAGLARQQQALRQQIANSESPATIARRARRLGMVPVKTPLFVNVKSGRIAGRPGPALGQAEPSPRGSASPGGRPHGTSRGASH